jgi:RNA polymerase sigma-70 factor, ECF subfamily
VLDQVGRYARELQELQPILLGIAGKLCRSRQEAADLVQDANERALKKLEHAAPEVSLKSWMISIVHNLFIDGYRQRARRPQLVSIENAPVDVSAPADTAAFWSDITAEQVRAAIARLPAEFRRVSELHLDGRSYDQIAAELGLPKATVGTRLSRARHRLKALLSEAVDEPHVAGGRR